MTKGWKLLPWRRCFAFGRMPFEQWTNTRRGFDILISDQQNIIGTNGIAQGRRFVRSERLTVVGRLLQPGNQRSDTIEHPAHDSFLTLLVSVRQFWIALLPLGYPSYIPSVIIKSGPDHCTEVDP